MSRPVKRQLSLARKILLLAAGVVALAELAL